MKNVIGFIVKEKRLFKKKKTIYFLAYLLSQISHES